MVTLESIERCLATPCNTCRGTGWMSGNLMPGSFWCIDCGGSGLWRTWREVTYRLTSLREPVPYLEEPTDDDRG